MASHQKTLSLIPWLCINKEIGQDLWKSPKTCHSKVKTILKQMKCRWNCVGCAQIQPMIQSVLFQVKEYFLRKNKWTLPLMTQSLCFEMMAQVDCHSGKTGSSKMSHWCICMMDGWHVQCLKVSRSLHKTKLATIKLKPGISKMNYRVNPQRI